MLKKTPEETQKYRTVIFDKPGDYNEQDVEPEEVKAYKDTILGRLGELAKKFQYEGVSRSLLSPGVLGRVGKVKLKAGVDINPKNLKRSVVGVKGRVAF